jgi:hypothetical protein
MNATLGYSAMKTLNMYIFFVNVFTIKTRPGQNLSSTKSGTCFSKTAMCVRFVRRIFVNTSSTNRTGLLNILMLHVLPWHSITVAPHCFITHVPQ